MIDINAALGMVERPLKVGDWVEAIDPHSKWPMARDMNKPMRVVDIVRRFGWDCLVLEGQKENPWVPYKFRRVDPPRDRDEVAELREQVRILNEICDDIRDTFGYSRDDMVDLTTCVAQDYAELKQQLSQVTKERDGLLEDRDHVCALLGIDEREHGWIVQYPGADDKLFGTFTDAMDAVSSDALDCEQERDTLREQLSTVQAEAAAMMGEIHRIVAIMYKWHAMVTLDDYAKLFGKIFGEVVQDAQALLVNTTAGRELLDEMQRKDERIRELESECDSSHKAYEKISAVHDRLWRKCSAAKRAYVETLRGKIDPAWFGEQSPVWQYRTSGRVNGCVWRFDGVRVQVTMLDGNQHEWITASAYSSWSECCDDPDTYPCDEHGKRLDTLIDVAMNEKNIDANGVTKLEQAIAHGDARPKIEFKSLDHSERIADLERQLAEHNRDAELCRELRALLKSGCHVCLSSGPGVLIVMPDDNGYDDKARLSVDIQGAIISIRGGGAK